MGWMKVPEQVLDEYNIDEDGDLNNHFAWPGFTSASRDTMATWDNRKSFCKDCHVLFMIDQDEGTGRARLTSAGSPSTRASARSCTPSGSNSRNSGSSLPILTRWSST